MIFVTNFISLIPKDKSNMTYQEFLDKFKMKLKYYEIEYKEEIESLIKSLYETKDEKYSKLYKAFNRVPYKIIMENLMDIEDLINNDDVDSAEVIKDFSEVCKKAGSIVNRVFSDNYIEFMNSEYSEKSCESLVKFVESITEDESEVLLRVCSEFDDYLYGINASPILMKLSDNVREKFLSKILSKGKQEIDKCNRLIDYRYNSDADIQAVKTHIMIMEKRRKHARYN